MHVACLPENGNLAVCFLCRLQFVFIKRRLLNALRIGGCLPGQVRMALHPFPATFFGLIPSIKFHHPFFPVKPDRTDQFRGMMASVQAGFSRNIATFTLPRHSTSGGRTETIMVCKQAAFESRTKKAHLTAVRKQRLKLPTSEHGYHFSEFLSLPEGVESALNVKVAKSFQVLDVDDCTYRVVLPQIRLLSFDAFPVMDVRATTTAENFTVEMLSFKFRGAAALESENDHLLGLMVSRIIWHTKGPESFLELKSELEMIMELVKLPFSLLPPAAVEIPGNMIMQAVVDNLTKELLENVVQDHNRWMKQQKLEQTA